MIAVHDHAASVGEVINIGSGFEISVGDTVRMIAEVMNADISVVSDDQRLRPGLSEVERLWACNQKARRLLGWEPQFGGLDGLRRGLGLTAEWFANPENRNRYKVGAYTV